MEFNNAFFEQLGQSPAVTALVTEVTEEVAAIARESAPVETGAYKRGIQTEIFRHKQKRAVGWVEATDKKSILIEAKTGNLARAIRTQSRKHHG